MDNSNQPPSFPQNPPAGDTPQIPSEPMPQNTNQTIPSPWPQASTASSFPNYQTPPTSPATETPSAPVASEAPVMAAYPPSQTPSPADSFWSNPITPSTEPSSPTWPPQAQQNSAVPSVEPVTAPPTWPSTVQPEPAQPSLAYTAETTTPQFTPAATDNQGGASVNTNPQDQFPQYIDPNTLAAGNVPSSTPLDNPYGVPAQAPSIDSGSLSESFSPAHSEPPWATSAQTPITATPTEQAPTDLSHLISNSDSITQAPPMQPETLVMPQAAPEVPTIPTETKGGIPKWVIGLGAGLLIIVAGASAYFILGIGQPAKNTSLPAAEPPKAQQQVSTPAPIMPTPTPQPTTPTASGSANFGDLQGSGTAPQASSAAEILRARLQQQGR